LPPEIYLKLARVAHFNPEDRAEARELDANLLEERYNTTLNNVCKYEAALKRYYNKSMVRRELNIGDLVLKKDIRTKDKHKFSTLWEGPFIIVDVTTPGAYVLAEVDGGMLRNTCNVDQLHKYYVLYVFMIKEAQFFFAHEIDIVSAKNFAFYTRSTVYKNQGAPDRWSLTQRKLMLFTHVASCTKTRDSQSMVPYPAKTYAFYTRSTTYKKQGAPDRRSLTQQKIGFLHA
jgi:hypothetical protein